MGHDDGGPSGLVRAGKGEKVQTTAFAILLRKIYGDEKAAEYIRLWIDAHASDPVEYILVQT